MTILITRHDKIGDFITALPMIKVLKEQTNQKIVVLVSKVNVLLANDFYFIDEVIEYTDNTYVLVKKIKEIKADVSISAYIDFHLGFCLFLAGIPKRIAPATKIAQIFFNDRVRQRRSEVKKTEWQYNLDLIKKFDPSLQLEFKKPLLKLNVPEKEFIIFHVGSGGSSDGNLTLDDYLRLAKKASEKIDVVFLFGPDDNFSKKYIENHINFKVTIRNDFKSLIDLVEFIATSKLFVSTSTGTMHLAGLTNTRTLSFFGSSLFSSSMRWSTISDIALQNNFEIGENYSQYRYKKIENKLMDII